MDRLELLSKINYSKDSCIEAYYYIVNNNISMMNYLIDALDRKVVGKEALLASLVESERKNEWLFPILLKLLYLDLNYLNSIFGYGLFEMYQRFLALSYRNDETCNSLLLNFICDSSLSQFVRSIALDTLSLLHLNSVIADDEFKQMMEQVYSHLDEEIITDFVIIATDHNLDFDFEQFYKDGLVNNDVYPYNVYLEEKDVKYEYKRKEMLKKDFFKLDINVVEYINKFLDK